MLGLIEAGPAVSSPFSQREISAKLGGEAGVKEKISHVKGVKGETIVIKI